MIISKILIAIGAIVFLYSFIGITLGLLPVDFWESIWLLLSGNTPDSSYSKIVPAESSNVFSVGVIHYSVSFIFIALGLFLHTKEIC